MDPDSRDTTDSQSGTTRDLVLRNWRLILILITAIAAGRVVATYRVFSQTYDEGAHVGAGLEWLATGEYRQEQQHPPLARIASAIGPYLAGAKYDPARGILANGTEAFHHQGRYSTILSFARAGILPFFVASILVVFLWARQLFGLPVALLSCATYSLLPPVLAHAGLATTDMAVGATVPATLLVFDRWLRRPSLARAALLGMIAAVALLSKLSAVLFLAAGGTVVLFLFLMDLRRDRDSGTSPRPRWIEVVVAILTGWMTLWAAYQFSVGPILAVRADKLDFLASSPAQKQFVRRLGSVPIPAPEFFGGVAEMLAHNRSGHWSYLMGKRKLGGWWYYFPIAFLLKTPIPFIALGFLPLIPLYARRRERTFAPMAPPLAAVAILLSTMPAKINIGIRHVLPMYPLLAVASGCALVWLWRRSLSHRVGAAFLGSWLVLSSVLAHPDYLAYFNMLAGRRPEYFLLDSNLDWGQDLLRLSREVRHRRIPRLMLSYFGTALPERHKLPPFEPADNAHPTPGWFAVSEMNVSGFPWLQYFKPVAQVGKSIRLYYIPSTGERGGEARSFASTLDYERCLLPLIPTGHVTRGAGNSFWISTLELRNRGSLPLHAAPSRRDLHPLAFRLDAQSAASNVPIRFTGEQAPGGVLFVEREKAAFVDITIRIQELVSHQSATIPGPCAASLSRNPVMLSNVSVASASRTVIRVYDLNSFSNAANVSVTKPGTGEVINSRQITLNRAKASDDPLGEIMFAELPLDELVTADSIVDVRVELLPPGSPALTWAFAMTTDLRSQTMNVVTPELFREGAPTQDRAR